MLPDAYSNPLLDSSLEEQTRTTLYKQDEFGSYAEIPLSRPNRMQGIYAKPEGEPGPKEPTDGKQIFFLFAFVYSKNAITITNSASVI